MFSSRLLPAVSVGFAKGKPRTTSTSTKPKKPVKSEVRAETIDAWKKIAEAKNYHLTNVLANDLYNAAWTGITSALIRHGRAFIPNIGTFTVR
jgi:hypothetical protein